MSISFACFLAAIAVLNILLSIAISPAGCTLAGWIGHALGDPARAGAGRKPSPNTGALRAAVPGSAKGGDGDDRI